MGQRKHTIFLENSFFWGLPAFLWQALFFYVPLAFLIAASFIKQADAVNSAHFTLEHYRALWQPIYISILLRSFLFASATVILCLIIAYPVAYHLALRVKKYKTVWFALLVLPFWTNFLLLVYAWYFLLENDGIINAMLLGLGLISTPLHLMNTPFATFCGMLYCYLPFMLLPLYSNFERIDDRLLEASYDLGGDYFQTFKRITLPLTLPGIQTGALLVFIPSFGEFVIPALLGGDKTMYVGSVITHYFLTIRNTSLGSAFTLMSTLVLISGIFIAFIIAAIIKMRKN
ncbi:ABC transporter permease [Candidatus Babeliales bacterium]|nr:ABC transporter permease [Candidatus Babeliales bacterium]